MCHYETSPDVRDEFHTTFKNKLFTYETYMTAKADTKEDEKYSTFVLYKAIKKVQLWTTKRLNLNKS